MEFPYGMEESGKYMSTVIGRETALSGPDSEIGVTNSSSFSTSSSLSPSVPQNRNYDILESRALSARDSRVITPGRRRFFMLMSGDLFALCLSVVSGYVLANLFRTVVFNDSVPIDTGSVMLLSTMFLIPVVVILGSSWSWGHYTRFRPTWTELQETTKACVYVGVANIVVLFAFKDTFSRLWIGFFVLTLVMYLPALRHLSRYIMTRLGWWLKSTYVVGTGENAVLTAAALQSDVAMGHRVEGFIDLDDRASQPDKLSGKPVFQQFPSFSSKDEAGENPCFVFAFESLSEMNKHRSLVDRYIALSPHSTVSPPITGLPLYGAEILTVFKQDTVLLKLQNRVNNPRTRFLKRTFDILVSISILLVLFPLMIGLYWLVGRDGSPATFGHARIGRNGKIFKCLKFRSMVVDGDSVLESHLQANPQAKAEWLATRKLSDDPRVTQIGKFLRKSSLDELPQLFNVLRGEMSLVGPRPIVQEEVFHYGDHIHSYLSMTPGITGLWQTSGRSDTTYRERVLLDVWYARNWSLWLDLVILMRTIPSLLKQSGAR